MKLVQENEKGKTGNTVHDKICTNSIRKLVIQFNEAVQVNEDGKQTLSTRFVESAQMHIKSVC